MKHPMKSYNLTTFLLALVVSVSLHVDAVGKGKPGGGGDGGDTTVPCLTFDNLAGDTVQSDAAGSYCNDPQNNVTATFTTDGHFSLDTEQSRKGGRSLAVDFGSPVVLLDRNNYIWEFQSTAELDAAGITHDFNLYVGAFQNNFNMLTMALGETRADVNLNFTLTIHLPGRNNDAVLFVKMAPEILDNDRQCEISDAVRVTCTAVDGAGNPIEWYVETQDPNNLACVSQEPFGHTEPDLYPNGLRNLSFGFTVTK